MKLAKSLLLGSAAGLMAVAGANAADLPVRAAAPAVDYVRICNVHGTGFFFIPGTDTCLRVSGQVRYEARFDEVRGRGGNAFQQFSRGELNVDSRTATDFGLLRTFVKLRADSLGNTTTAAFAPQAFIQFGGLTAGRAPNFFTFAGSPAFRGDINVRGGTEVDQIAYSATFGSVVATVALQSRVAASYVGDAEFGVGGLAGAGVNRGGNRLPDVVAALDYSAGGFRVKVAGALTEIRSNRTIAPGVTNPSDKFGFAILGGVSGTFGATSVALQGTYADGALWFANVGQPTALRRAAAFPTADAVIVNNSFRTTKAWSVMGTLAQRWTPQLSQNVYASYGRVTPPTAARGPGGLQRFESWQVGTNVSYTVVPGLLVGADVNYAHVNAKAADLAVGARRTDSRWTSTIRIQRDF